MTPHPVTFHKNPMEWQRIGQPLHFTNIPEKSRKKRLPSGQINIVWAIKLYSLLPLAWDYIETICDLSANIGASHTKPLVRQVRQLKREYEIFRSRDINGADELMEKSRALRFEELVRKTMWQYSNAVGVELDRCGLKGDERYLAMAVFQAMVIMDAVNLYARWCDRQLAKDGLWVADRCMVQNEYLALDRLIPLFADPALNKEMPSRKVTAGMLYNKLREIPMSALCSPQELEAFPEGFADER